MDWSTYCQIVGLIAIVWCISFVTIDSIMTKKRKDTDV